VKYCNFHSSTPMLCSDKAVDNSVRCGGYALQSIIGHRRTSSLSMPVPGMEGLYAGSEITGMHRSNAGNNSVDPDVFPPVRSQAVNISTFLAYIPEDIAFEEEYEEYLSDLRMSEDVATRRDGGVSGSISATWAALDRLPNFADNISDSESVISIGDLGEEARFEDKEIRDENRNDWEHMSPKTMAALPKSPAGGNRRSSSGSQLRPVLPFDLDDGSALEDEEAVSDEPEMGPMPREGASFGAAEGGKGVDEVEFMYNE